MDRFDDEAKKLIAEIMRDCSSRADDKIAALCRRVADERAVEIAALREKLTQAQHDLSGAQALEAQNIAALQSANAELAQLRPVVQMFVNNLKNCDSPILKSEDIDQE